MRIIHPVITFLLVSPAYLWTTKLELVIETQRKLFQLHKTHHISLSKDKLRKFATSRILYYSNSITTFNFLLACVDDIETNPGPENLPCSINQPTLNSPSDYHICWTSNDYNFCSSCLIMLHFSFGLLCDTCNVWFHGWCHLGSLY